MAVARSTPPFVDTYTSSQNLMQTEIIVKSGASLPGVCVHTGESVSDWQVETTTLKYSPAYLWIASILVPVLLPFMLILYVVTARGRSCRIRFGLSQASRDKLSRRRKRKWNIFLALLLTMIVTAAFGFDTVALIVALAMSASVVAVFVGNSPLWIKRVDGDRFHIGGCSQAFLRHDAVSKWTSSQYQTSASPATNDENLRTLRRSAIYGLVAGLLLALSLLGVVVYLIAMLAPERDGLDALGQRMVVWSVIVLVTMLVMLVISLIGVLTNRKKLALVTGAIPGAAMCLLFPVGTIVGLMLLTSLFNRKFVATSWQ